MAQSQVKTTFKIPSDYSDEDTHTVAEEVLNYIVERTKAGNGKDNKPFPKYSKAYTNSLDFKIAGKTGKVDLTLSGEMLDSLEILKASKGKIEIGYSKGSDMNGRAEGNILGTYGKDKANKSKARNFLGISDKEIAKIINKLDILPRDIQNEIGASARSNAKEMVDGFEFNTEED